MKDSELLSGIQVPTLGEKGKHVRRRVARLPECKGIGHRDPMASTNSPSWLCLPSQIMQSRGFVFNRQGHGRGFHRGMADLTIIATP